MSIRLALFCKVVDNFGDIGICYRLARQLVTEHGIAVTLWVDDLISFQRICPELSVAAAEQQVQGIRVVHWVDQNGSFADGDVPDIVIEFFGCDLPPACIAAMPRRAPVWINLEGLSAEDWVEGCHTLASPQHGMNKYFFYPGFTARTGGLLLESGLLQQRAAFLQNPDNAADFLSRLGVTDSEIASTRVSLFCYPHAPVQELFDAWQDGSAALTCLVPEGVAPVAVRTFLGQAQSSATRGALTLRVIPFLPQPDYDRLLWSCDFNFVRGEDSFVRAQWAGHPFIWHIYPQDNNLHHVKLKAFLERTDVRTQALVNFSLAWNAACSGRPDFRSLWRDLLDDSRKLANLTPQWQAKLITNGDLASNLLQFSAGINRKASENQL